MALRRTCAAIAALAIMLATASPALAGNWYMMLGARVASLDNPPVIHDGGRSLLNLEVLRELGLEAPQVTAGQDELDLHYNVDEGKRGGSVAVDMGGTPGVSLLSPPQTGKVPPLKSGRVRYGLAGNLLDLPVDRSQAVAELNGSSVASGQLKAYNGELYADVELMRSLGLYLSFNTVEDLYQLVGLVRDVNYSRDSRLLTISCLTPVQVEGRQIDDERVELSVEGGFFGSLDGREFGDDPVLSRVGFKTQPELGRSYVFLRQPSRTGFKVDSDERRGFASVRFGNYLQVASYNQTSSGEISLNVQLGRGTVTKAELISNPDRLVVDFVGAQYREATQYIPVNVGSVQQIRIGTPEENTVRIVLDLQNPVDYRLLSKDGGARHFLQLLPHSRTIGGSSGARKGRTIMLDAGHGGSDPGAQGVLDGYWEAPNALAITGQLREQLQAMGYDVILTRSDDRFVSLGTRTDYANALLPYLFVSVHCNWIDDPEMQGIMTFHHPASSTGPVLADHIQRALISSTGGVDKKVRQANFFVLRESVMPSALVECGFMSNREECLRLADPNYQLQLARGIAAGIDSYIQAGN
ncbi:MAG: N-acetylmuramoyl-L-alanine amidase [Planctomycetales bacterium]|nr:MAG: N-acetylmuramoyl-L-alanine amidase [Planctomycetales bacterium]